MGWGGRTTLQNRCRNLGRKGKTSARKPTTVDPIGVRASREEAEGLSAGHRGSGSEGLLEIRAHRDGQFSRKRSKFGWNKVRLYLYEMSWPPTALLFHGSNCGRHLERYEI